MADRGQNEENENRNRDWERGLGRPGYDRGASERGYAGRDPDYGRSYNRGSSARFNRSSFGGDWERGNFPLDYNRRPEQGWASDMDWDEEPVWTYSEYWWIVPGPYAGVGPQGYQRSDERLCDEVCERMAQHGHLDASSIHVDIDQGEATLTGTVSSRREKRLAEDITESVFGVKDVHNQLRIRSAEGRRAPGSGSQGSSARNSAPVSSGYDRPDREIAANAGRPATGANPGEQNMSGPDYGNRSPVERQPGGQPTGGRNIPDQNDQSIRRYGDQDLSNQPEGSQTTGAQSIGGQNIGTQPASGQGTDFNRWESSSTSSTQVFDYQRPEDRRPEDRRSENRELENRPPEHRANEHYDQDLHAPDASQNMGERRRNPESSRATISTGLPMQGTPNSADQPRSDRGAQPHTSGDSDTGSWSVESDNPGPEIKVDESFTAATLPSGGNLRSRIQPDMDVVDRQGDPVGQVKEVRQSDFLVDRPLARDVYVPFSACQSFEKEVRLNIRSDEVDQQDWELSDLFGSSSS